MLECAIAAKRSGLEAESKALIERVANEPHWERFPKEQSAALCMLAHDALENRTRDATQNALADLLKARRLGEPSGDALLLESRVHLLLGQYATSAGDDKTAKLQKDEARECLRQIPTQSADYKAAQEALSGLK